MDAMKSAQQDHARRDPRRCEQARLMSDYVDGELDPAERKRLERHVRFLRPLPHRAREPQTEHRTAGSLKVSDPPGADTDALAERMAAAGATSPDVILWLGLRRKCPDERGGLVDQADEAAPPRNPVRTAIVDYGRRETWPTPR